MCSKFNNDYFSNQVYISLPHLKTLKTLLPDVCTGLPDIENLKTVETFPVNYNKEVLVECDEGQTLFGSSSITCSKGTTFTFTTQPSCLIGMYLIGPNLNGPNVNGEGSAVHN